MEPSSSDLLMLVGDPGTATTLSAPGYSIGQTSVNVGSTANWPTTTGVIFAIDRAEVNPQTGREERIEGTYCEFAGKVDSETTVTEVLHVKGEAQDYPPGALTRVYIVVSAERENRIVEWGLAHANQDGSLKDKIVSVSNVDGGSSAGVLKTDENGDASWGLVTPDTLAQSAKPNYQTDNNNSIANVIGADVKIQAGWSQIEGNGTNAITSSITFPESFSEVLGYMIFPIGGKTSLSPNIAGLDVTAGVGAAIRGGLVTNSGFDYIYVRNNTTSAGSYYGVSWIAWGIV